MASLEESVSNLLRRTSDWLFGMPFGRFVAGIWVAAIVQNGIWVRPRVQTLLWMSQNPFRNLLPDQPEKHYLYTSFLGLVLARASGTYGHVWSYALLHLVELVAGGTLAFYRVRRTCGDPAARLAGVLFLCSPLALVLLTWLGIGDNLVFIFSTLVVLSSSPAEAFAWAFLLGLSHLEQSVFICGLFALGAVFGLRTLGANRPERLGKAGGALLGAVVAAVLLKAMFARLHFDLKEDRIMYFLHRGPAVFLTRFFRHPTTTLYSLFNVAWIGVVYLLAWLKRKRAPVFHWGLLSLSACLLLSMLVYDVTRVFALVCWPMLLVLCLECGREDAPPWGRSLRQGAALCVVLSFLLPKAMIWDGTVYGTPRYYDWQVLRGKIDFRNPDWVNLP